MALFRTHTSEGESKKEPRKSFKDLRRWQKVTLGVLAALLVAGAIVAAAVVPAAQSGLALARTIKGAMAAKAWDEQTAAAAQEQAHALHQSTQGPVWDLLCMIPGVGEDVAFARKLTAAADEAAPSFGWLLGMDAPRRYLVVAQGNSELRSTGGFPGAYVFVTVDHGVINIGDFMSANEKMDPNVNHSKCTDEEKHVADDLLDLRVSFITGDANVVPDFPRAAQLMMNFKEAQGHGKFDGVVAVDPFVMQAFLGLMGSVTLSDGTVLDSKNTARFILHDVYNLAATDPEQDKVFYEAGKLVVQEITEGISKVNPIPLLNTIRSQIQDGHILIYVSNDIAQSAATVAECDGSVSHDSVKPEIGVYVNSIDSSKDSWYADVRTNVGKRVVNHDGSITYTVVTTVSNTATLEEMKNAGNYISKRIWHRTDYAMRNSLIFMAPAGGDISDLKVHNAKVVTDLNQAKTTLYGNAVYAISLWTKLEETSTVSYKITTAPHVVQPLGVWQTPMCQVFD